MSQRGLEALLRPKSIAVIGASENLSERVSDDAQLAGWRFQWTDSPGNAQSQSGVRCLGLRQYRQPTHHS